MDRSPSPALRDQARYYHDSPVLKSPWDNVHPAPIPFLKSTSPPLTAAEWQALPSLWATRDPENTPHHRTFPPSQPDHHRPGQFTPRLRSLSEDSLRTTGSFQQSRGATTPPHGPSPLFRSRPFDPVCIPPGPKSAPTISTFVKEPLTPPHSAGLSISSATTAVSMGRRSSEVSQTRGRTHVVALPGTMTSRPSPERSRSRSSTRLHHTTSRTEARSPRSPRTTTTTTTTTITTATTAPTATPASPKSKSTLGKRFKQSLKGMFRREPIDEASFEPINERHWTDE